MHDKVTFEVSQNNNPMAEYPSDHLTLAIHFDLRKLLTPLACHAPVSSLTTTFRKQSHDISNTMTFLSAQNPKATTMTCSSSPITASNPSTSIPNSSSLASQITLCGSVTVQYGVRSSGADLNNTTRNFCGNKRGERTKCLKTSATISCATFRTVFAILLAGLGLALVSGAKADDSHQDPVRLTSEGPVKGYLHRLAQGRGVSERYLGIPFASPPIGSRRFQRPSPAPKRDSTLKVTKIPPACMQSGHDTSYISDYMPTYDESMDEDCLYLNIYLPHRPQTQHSTPTPEGLLPVLVHIHGGSNEVGASFMFQPDALAVLGNMVVVTVNYRLGALGFLTAPHIDIYGNMGLWDQVMALGWIQDNIEKFGGNPAKVTLQGHSAGAVNVGLHTMSPESKGLFRNAILQSGSPLADWGVLPSLPPGDNEKGPSQHLAAIGCPDTSQKLDTLACLQTVDVLKIVDAHYQHAPDYYMWSGTVDGQFLPEAPASLLDSGHFNLNAQTVMVGLVKDEGSLTAEAVVKNQMFLQKHDRLPTAEEVSSDKTHVTNPPKLEERDFDFSVAGYRNIHKIQELSAYTYFPWHDPTNKTEVIIALSDYAGDITFVAPAVKFLEKVTALESVACFMYVIDHRSSLSKFPPWMGSIHGEDLAYVFGCPLDGQCGRNFTKLDVELSLSLIEMWSNFVHTGFPSVPSILQSPEPYQNNKAYISISTDSIRDKIECGSSKSIMKANTTNNPPSALPSFSIKHRFRAPYMKFWNSLLPSFSNGSRNDVTTVSWMYRVATLTLAASLVAVTLALVAVSIILIYVVKKRKEREVKKQEVVGADKCLL